MNSLCHKREGGRGGEGRIEEGRGGEWRGGEGRGGRREGERSKSAFEYNNDVTYYVITCNSIGYTPNNGT